MLQQPQERYKILNATSNCPFNKCDGNGISLICDTKTNETFGKPCKCKETLMYNKILNSSQTPDIFKNVSLGDFKVNIYKNREDQITALLAKRAVYNFIVNFEEFKAKGKGIYLHSNRKGTGKTMLAAASANSIIKSLKLPLKFISSLDLLDEIKKTYNENSKCSECDLIHSFRNIDVLIIDDIGVERQTSWINDKLYSILNYRMENKKVTLFTSNCSIDNLNLDERIVSRINIMAVPIKMPEESIRSYTAQNDNLYYEKILYSNDKGDV